MVRKYHQSSLSTGLTVMAGADDRGYLIDIYGSGLHNSFGLCATYMPSILVPDRYACAKEQLRLLHRDGVPMRFNVLNTGVRGQLLTLLKMPIPKKGH